MCSTVPLYLRAALVKVKQLLMTTELGMGAPGLCFSLFQEYTVCMFHFSFQLHHPERGENAANMSQWMLEV